LAVLLEDKINVCAHAVAVSDGVQALPRRELQIHLRALKGAGVGFPLSLRLELVQRQGHEYLSDGKFQECLDTLCPWISGTGFLMPVTVGPDATVNETFDCSAPFLRAAIADLRRDQGDEIAKNLFEDSGEEGDEESTSTFTKVDREWKEIGVLFFTPA
jgi:hypothetical protein